MGTLLKKKKEVWRGKKHDHDEFERNSQVSQTYLSEKMKANSKIIARRRGVSEEQHSCIERAV